MKSRMFVLLLALAGAAFAQPAIDGAPRHGARSQTGTGWWNGRQVHFHVVDGMAITEGDINLGPVEELLTPPAADASRASLVITNQANRWPNKTVIYQIEANFPNPARVTDAMAHWEAKTSIRFKQRTTEAAYASIRRAASNCVSSVGYLGTVQAINLGDSCTTPLIIHELGHTVGLLHEQTRIDRSLNIRVNFENVDKTYWSQYNQRLTDSLDVGPYDYGSVMQYPNYSTFANGFRNDMDSVPLGMVLTNAPELSAGDIQSVERFYGATISEVVISSYPLGLSMLVDGQTITTPKSFAWSPGETHTVQAATRFTVSNNPNLQLRLAKWSDGGATRHDITVDAKTNLYIANYATYYKLQTGVTGGGSVNVWPESSDQFYPHGAVLRLTAVPNGDQRFFGWISGPNGTAYLLDNGQGNASNPVELTLRRSDSSYVAQFAAATLSFTTITSNPPRASVTIDGAAVYTPVARSWAPGSTHTISIAQSQFFGGVDRRFQFVDWSNGGDRNQTLTASAQDTVVTANLKQQWAVDFGLDGLISRGASSPTRENLRVSPTSPDGYYDAGSTIEFEASGVTGTPFSNWYGDLSSSTSKQSLTVDQQLSVTAYFLSDGLFDASSLVNAASLQPTPAVPGANMLLYRPNSGPETPVSLDPDADGKYPTTSNGVTVMFGTRPAQIYGLFKNGIYIIPPDIDGTSVSVTARAGTAAAFTRTLPALPAAPGIYTTDPVNGFGQAVSINEDGSENTADNPAAVGSVMVFLATGLGKISDDGTPVLPIAAEVGGVPAEVLGIVAGRDPGDYGVGIVLDPATPTGPNVPLALYIGGTRSQFKVTISVK